MIMRKNYQMWLLGALFGGLVLPFAGCSNEDDPMPNGPGSGETFETELSIALAAGKGTSTKATDDEIQNDPNVFNGLRGIKLISYSNTDWATGGGISADNFAATSASMIIDAHNLETISAGSNVEAGNYVKNQQSLTLKKQSQGFVFYGASAYGNPVGKLETNIAETGTLADTNFDLKPLATPDAYKNGMEAYLKKVYTALYDLNSDYVVDDGDPDALYGSLNSAKSGSFMQIADLMAQLYVMADELDTQSDGSALKSVILDGGEIFTSAPTGTYTPDTGSGASFSGLSYTADGSLANLLAEANVPEAYYNLSFCDHGTDGSTGDFLSESKTNDYAFPAALYYFVNTYPVSYDGGTFEALTWTKGTLDSYTTLADLGQATPAKIAMAHSVQYAVGRLDVSLKGETTLKDYADHDISFSDFELKGVLIGNQQQVGWNFLPNGSGSQMVIYDNMVGTKASYVDTNADEYIDVAKVLALPTKDGESVRIALEFLYTGTSTTDEFVGANGQKIPEGSIFYVTGLLQVSEGVGSVDNVFVSDYKTTAKLTLTSVKSAQNTVPDLSNEGGNLEFALSVDLSWEAGLNFEINIGDEIQ